MVKRIINPLKSNSFFLFGARATGKTTFLKETFAQQPTLWFDLLDPELEERFALHPNQFKQEILQALSDRRLEWIVVDEIQKAPKLLNIAHQLIEEKKLKFALTGSSARRLKQKGTNLLAGRAFNESLFPFSSFELGEQFDLNEALTIGTLPPLYELPEPAARHQFLRSYTLNYIKNEIQAEQWVRKLDPFRRFLQIAAQMNGQVLNLAGIAKDVGVDWTTIQNYYTILADTLLGFEVPAFRLSVRKQQSKGSKFYFFDPGVKRALEKTHDIPIRVQTSDFGHAFEHWVILEIFRLNQYTKKDFELSYLRTNHGAEIDLILSKAGKPKYLIEIKSKEQVDESDARHLKNFAQDLSADYLLLSRDPRPKKFGKIHAFPWQDGIRQMGLNTQ